MCFVLVAVDVVENCASALQLQREVGKVMAAAAAD
jgi:hypothetical protein